ncbi:MAG: hypothetical protein U0S50_01860 [Sphingopyxis sp.]|nr:hypothetical protein [Sphingopyxis sp.]
MLITGLLLFMILSFGLGKPTKKRDEFITVVSLEAAGKSDGSPEPDSRQREQTQERPEPPRSPPLPPPPIPSPAAEPKAAPSPPQTEMLPPSQPTPQAVLRPSDGRVYGPPNRGAPASNNTERVGTAPNGEPLYAAVWYREPSDNELRGYLSTANGPGWGLIACRTAPDYRVEDCVALDEYPQGSQINRAVLAASWQFRVRPPRRGGRLLVGSWVRIRIDYGIRRR